MYNTIYHSQPLNQFTFLVTGGAGFIGSHLVEYLLQHGAKEVRVLDNLLTGNENNVELFKNNSSYKFIHGDIRSADDCSRACSDCDFIFHEAALGSVPRSMEDPMTTHDINSTGFLNLMNVAKKKNAKRLVYASSSSVYGDHPDLPKKEDQIGNPMSPYAVTKLTNELYAQVFASQFGMEIIGLRYFNIFGTRQDPNGPYAAVIPRFMDMIQKNQSPTIYGDGLQTRDFTFVENAIQANIKAMFAEHSIARNQIFNVAAGESFSVLQLFDVIRKQFNSSLQPTHAPVRKGDIPHSLADISKAKSFLNYDPSIKMHEGIQKTAGEIMK